MKKNTWNVRRLVNESFVPSNQQTSVLYCRLSDFNWRLCLFNKYVPTLYNGDLFYVDSFPHQEKGTIVFCLYNCSDILRENLFEQWNVLTIFKLKQSLLLKLLGICHVCCFLFLTFENSNQIKLLQIASDW